MQQALRQARSVLGRTAPNPAVGCVLVKDGRVIAAGATGLPGQDHAEAAALKLAGSDAAGATAYVTLEPCAHYGRTPPCAHALRDAGVERVVIACADPDPRVSGRGLQILRDAGIAVRTGCLTHEALFINRGFMSRLLRKRPWVVLKLAVSLDGKIACHNGHSQWITGEAARLAVHRLRATADAILIGSGTLAQDDPRLTVRLPDEPERAPWRVVLEGRHPCRADAGIFNDAFRDRTIVIGTRPVDPEAATGPIRITCAGMSEDGSRVDLTAAMALLADRGINSVLIEGGSGMAGALLAAGLVDEVTLFRAPCIIGGDGLSAIGPLGLTDVGRSIRLSLIEAENHGGDREERYLTAVGETALEQIGCHLRDRIEAPAEAASIASQGGGP